MRGVSAPVRDSGDSAKSQRPHPTSLREATFSRCTGEGCVCAILVVEVESTGVPPSPACGRRWRGATDEGCLRPNARLRRFNQVVTPLIRPRYARPPSPVPREKGCVCAILVVEVESTGVPPSPACGRTQRGATDEGCLRPSARLRRFSQVSAPSSDLATRGHLLPLHGRRDASARFWLLKLNQPASLLLPPAGEGGAERRMRGVSAPTQDSADSTKSQDPSSDPR